MLIFLASIVCLKVSIDWLLQNKDKNLPGIFIQEVGYGKIKLPINIYCQYLIFMDKIASVITKV